MVPLIHQDSFLVEIESDPELRPLKKFIFREQGIEGVPENSTWPKLFNALVKSDSKRFQEHIADLALRSCSSESEWIGDDCMVFLLLIGERQFNITVPFLGKLLDCRRETTNLQMQRVNQVFDAIRKEEFAMEGDLAFIKLVFKSLTSNWNPTEDDCSKIFHQLLKPGLFTSLDSFWKLVAIRAQHLLFQNKASSFTGQGIWIRMLDTLQQQGSTLTVGQVLQLTKHLRISVFVTIVGFVGSTMTMAFLAGGYWSKITREKPAAVQTFTPTNLDLITPPRVITNPPATTNR